MADVIELLIKARAERGDIDALLQDLKAVQQAVKSLESQNLNVEPAAIFEMASPQDVANAVELNRVYTERVQLLKEAAKYAFGQGDQVSAQNLLQQANAISKVNSQLASTITHEDRLNLVEEKYNSTLSHTIQNTSMLTNLRNKFSKTTSEGTKAIQSQIQALIQQGEARLQQERAFARTGDFDSVKVIQDEVKALRNRADVLNQTLEPTERLRLADTALATSMEKTAEQVRRTSGGLGGFIGKLNEVAFSIFITQSSLNTFISLGAQALDGLVQSAGRLDSIRGFSVALGSAGINAQKMGAELRQASGGVVEMGIAYRETTRLVKAGNIDAAKAAPTLLEISKATARLSGNLEDTTHIYQTLVTGIVRGSPLLIDNSDIYLKLGEANEKYAESIGKTVEQLSEAEKQQAVFNEIMRQGSRLVELSEQSGDSYQENLLEMRQSLAETSTVWKDFFAVGIVDLVNFKNEWIPLRDKAVMAIGGIVGSLTIAKEILGAFWDYSKIAFGALKTTLNAVKESYVDLVMAQEGLRTGTLSISEAWDMASGSVNHFLDAADQLGNGEIEAQLQAVEDRINNADMVGAKKAEEYMNLFNGTDESALAAANSVGIFSDALNAVSWTVGTTMLTQLNAAFSETAELMADRDEKLADAVADSQEKLLALRGKYGDKLKDIEGDLNKKLEDLLEDRNERYVEIAEDLGRKISDINQDLANKISDLQEDFRIRRQDAEQDHNDELLDLQEDYYDKLEDIERKFELSRTKALIDRDARALYEAQLERQNALSEANDDYKDSYQEEVQSFKDKLVELRELEERRIRDANIAAERRRRDANIAADRQRADTLKSYERRREDAINAAKERREDAKEQYEEDLKQLKESLKDKKAEILEWYQDQLEEQRKAAIKRRFEEIKNQIEEEGLTRAHVATLTEIWTDYQKFIGNLNLTPSSSSSMSPIGNSFPSVPDRSDSGEMNIAQGAPCNIPSEVNFWKGDIQYNCINGKWARKSGRGSRGTGGQSSGLSSGNSISSPAPSQTGTQVVTIRATGDKTLEAIFKEMAYEAVIEVVS